MRRYVALSLLLPPKHPLTSPNNGLPLLALDALDRGLGLLIPTAVPYPFQLIPLFLAPCPFPKTHPTLALSPPRRAPSCCGQQPSSKHLQFSLPPLPLTHWHHLLPGFPSCPGRGHNFPHARGRTSDSRPSTGAVAAFVGPRCRRRPSLLLLRIPQPLSCAASGRRHGYLLRRRMCYMGPIACCQHSVARCQLPLVSRSCVPDPVFGGRVPLQCWQYDSQRPVLPVEPGVLHGT